MYSKLVTNLLFCVGIFPNHYPNWRWKESESLRMIRSNSLFKHLLLNTLFLIFIHFLSISVIYFFYSVIFILYKNKNLLFKTKHCELNKNKYGYNIKHLYTIINSLKNVFALFNPLSYTHWLQIYSRMQLQLRSVILKNLNITIVALKGSIECVWKWFKLFNSYFWLSASWFDWILDTARYYYIINELFGSISVHC